jgi:uncharacterized SAM-binding protein YcdF (DUF218 family)
MDLHLVRRRTIWWPTLLGWIALVALLASPLLFWWFQGETFFALTERQPADVLLVEGWIGREGLEASKAEFEHGGYRYLVTCGGLATNNWDRRQWNYAEEAGGLMIRLGVPADRVIEAPAPDTPGQRTYMSALAARQTLEARGLHPETVNVFTIGSHARRSRLIFAKALTSKIHVGVISWAPKSYFAGPWWKSSDRAEDMIKETVGYAYELLLNSGRWSNAPKENR